MFWCHNCQHPINSVQQLQCELCSSQAIEQFFSENNPQNFQPYVSQSNSQGTNNNNNSNQNTNQMPGQAQSFFQNFVRETYEFQMMQAISQLGPMRTMSTILTDVDENNSSLFLRYSVTRPIFRILLLNSEQEQKILVSEQKINSLQKVQIKQQCAICQQKDDFGLKLPCNHEFHEKCIRPWFREANTCPCCRSTVE